MTKGLMANTVHESQQPLMVSTVSFPLSASINSIRPEKLF